MSGYIEELIKRTCVGEQIPYIGRARREISRSPFKDTTISKIARKHLKNKTEENFGIDAISPSMCACCIRQRQDSVLVGKKGK